MSNLLPTRIPSPEGFTLPTGVYHSASSSAALSFIPWYPCSLLFSCQSSPTCMPVHPPLTARAALHCRPRHPRKARIRRNSLLANAPPYGRVYQSSAERDRLNSGSFGPFEEEVSHGHMDAGEWRRWCFLCASRRCNL